MAQAVLDFGVNPVSVSGASGSGSGTAQTVAPGKVVTYMLAVTPTAGTQLPLAMVFLGVLFLPSRLRCVVVAGDWDGASRCCCYWRQALWAWLD
jgi:hypothetical protein